MRTWQNSGRSTVPKLGIGRGVPLPRRRRRLIENARLRSRLSSRRSSQLQISNRERTAISLRAFSPSSSFGPQADNLQILIANLELESRLTGCKTNQMQFSNRKFSALFHCRLPSPRSTRLVTRLSRAGAMPAKGRLFVQSGLAAREGSLITALPWPCCARLIETPRLKFPVTLTNAPHYKILIGTKTALSRSVFHRTTLPVATSHKSRISRLASLRRSQATSYKSQLTPSLSSPLASSMLRCSRCPRPAWQPFPVRPTGASTRCSPCSPRIRPS